MMLVPTSGFSDHVRRRPILNLGDRGQWRHRRGRATRTSVKKSAAAQIGGRIGLVDADILGPSIPGMLGLPVGQRHTGTFITQSQKIITDKHDIAHQRSRQS